MALGIASTTRTLSSFRTARSSLSHLRPKGTPSKLCTGALSLARASMAVLGRSSPALLFLAASRSCGVASASLTTSSGNALRRRQRGRSLAQWLSGSSKTLALAFRLWIASSSPLCSADACARSTSSGLRLESLAASLALRYTWMGVAPSSRPSTRSTRTTLVACVRRRATLFSPPAVAKVRRMRPRPWLASSPSSGR